MHTTRGAVAVVREDDAPTSREAFLDEQLTRARLAARAAAVALVAACDGTLGPEDLSTRALDASLAAADLRAAARAITLPR
jgi:hypothetical protein